MRIGTAHASHPVAFPCLVPLWDRAVGPGSRAVPSAPCVQTVKFVNVKGGTGSKPSATGIAWGKSDPKPEPPKTQHSVFAFLTRHKDGIEVDEDVRPCCPHAVMLVQ